MDGLLDSSRGNLVCSSIQDLQDKLHSLLAFKSSDTRAEHTSSTFEFRHNTVFHLNTDAEHDLTDAVINPGQSQQQQQLPITRSVNSSEVVQNQPADNPILQQAVAEHIVSAIGQTDGSSWIVQQVSRDAQEWTLKYICKDSLQTWNQANAKNAGKQAIGSYSGPGGLDPANLSRPAFDCRGTLTIAFSKSTRGVVVNYSHTPIHKTVAQLVELLAPSPPPEPVNGSNVTNQRTPKAKRPPPTEGEEGGRRKRAKKKSKAPEAPMGDASRGDGQNSQNDAGPQDADSSNQQATSVLNVPPAEAERRMQTAIELLNGKGIDPATLSAEQFNIFANQAPNLQTVSLDMLARYGAERLRIVHPDDRDQPSASSTPGQEQSTNATSANELANTATPASAETPTKKRGGRKKKSDVAKAEVSIGNGAVVSLEQSGECTKEHPSCKICNDAGMQCVYLPPKPRRRSKKPDEVLEQEDSDVPGEDENSQAHNQVQASPPATAATATTAAAATAPATAQHSAHNAVPPPSDPDNEEFIPDPNILTGHVEHQPATSSYYQTNDSGLTFPQNPQPSSEHAAMSTLAFPQPQTHETQPESSHSVTFPSTSHPTEHSSGSTLPQLIPATTQKRQNTLTPSRRSLPTTQNKQMSAPTPIAPTHTPSWNASPAVGHTTASPTPTQAQPSVRSKPRKSGVEANQQTYDGMNQAAAFSQDVTQTQTQPSPVIGSPYQTTARTMSRQSHRSQTNTPVASASRPPPQAPQTATNTSFNTTSSSSIPNYDPYARYDSSTNDQYTNTSNDQGPTRITYEPGSYHPIAATTATTSVSYSSAPAYDYSRSTASSNPLSQALKTGGYSTGNRSPATTQWPTSQTRGSQSHTQPHTTNSYSMTPTAATSSRNYATSSTEIRTSHQNASYNQPQSQSYESFPAQQPASNQQTQQSWYGFAAAGGNSSTNQSNYNNNRNSGYGGSGSSSHTTPYGDHRTNAASYPSHSYGTSSDDQSLYDLLRASGSTHQG
ncbi:hypothetical protein AAE478_000321 [Parahypoxylon ruwenzoriense]